MNKFVFDAKEHLLRKVFRLLRLKGSLLAVTLLFSAVSYSHAETFPCATSAIDGHWEGTMTRNMATIPVGFDFACVHSELTGSFTSLTQRAMEYPFDSAKQVGDQVDLVLGGELHLSGRIDHSRLAGTFKDEDGSGSYELKRTAKVKLPYSATDVVFHNGPVSLSGTLYVPRREGLHPAIVMLQGSGPETRWGANRFWADYFGRRGIACLIYDKRGAGQSTGDWKTSDFDALAGDALAGVSLLQHQAGIDPMKIGIHGHSQGASIAPLIASKSNSIAFILADAASGVSMWQSEIFSQQSGVRHSGLSSSDQASAEQFIERAVQVERSGIGYDVLRNEYKAAQQSGQAWTEEVGLPPEDSYFIKFFPAIANYNPADYWKLVHVPVLIVEAGEDERVPVAPSVAAIQQALSENKNPDFTIIVFPHASHPLVDRSRAGEPFHWSRITPGYADLLTSWVLYRESYK
jgi:pimeloyl-ACP methyl ester carboxylesterase